MKHRRIGIAVISVIMLWCSAVPATAAENYQLLQISTQGEQITAYIEGSTETQQIECQIGTTPCDEVQAEKMSADNLGFHTIVLVDNSLSVTQENKEKAIGILKEYVLQKGSNEYVTLATFGEDIQFLAEKTNDVGILQAAIDSIQYNNQDTYLTDVLYDLLDTLDGEEYTRFIVVSDGVDNKPIGITKEELTEKLKDHAHPIYALGHYYKNNETELENMFALTRATNGKEFLLDDIDSVSEVAGELTDVGNMTRVTTTIPKELRDGSEKNILYKIKDATGINEIKARINMPFSIIEKPAVQESAPQIPKPVEKPVEAVSQPVTEPPEARNTQEPNFGGLIAGIAIIAVIVAAALLLFLKNSKNKSAGKRRIKPEQKKEKKAQVPPPEKTVYLPDDEEETVLFGGRYLLVLKDEKDSEKVFRYPLDAKVVIGRNTDKVNIAIDYNLTISGRHCEIYAKNNRFYIRDLNSSNKTYLNEKIVEREMEMSSQCKVRLGEVEFSVEFIPI